MSQAFFDFTNRHASQETKSIILQKRKASKHSPTKRKAAIANRPIQTRLLLDSDTQNSIVDHRSSLIQTPHDESAIPGMSEALELPDSED